MEQCWIQWQDAGPRMIQRKVIIGWIVAVLTFLNYRLGYRDIFFMPDTSSSENVLHYTTYAAAATKENEVACRIANATIEMDRMIPLAKELQDAELCHSLRHQQKFFTVRDPVLTWIKSRPKQEHLLRGTGKRGFLFAFIINKNYAFRHIFKSGGTTVLLQTKRSHTIQRKVENRRLMTTVRDPIDHFLSGWAECGKRNFKAMMNLTTSDEYDDQIQAWLQYIQGLGNFSKTELKSKNLRTCSPHSYPQANYLWERDNKFQWDAKLDLVGDLKELTGLLELVGFPYNASIPNGRVAQDSKIKMKYFPKNKSLLTNRTMQDICRYVALDFYLFDFDLPIPCRKELMANVVEMNISVPY